MPTETISTPETEVVTDNESQSKPENKWTLMFYIAGDASLSASMISQLKELTDAGYQENTTVLVYFDPNCNGRNARIFEVNHYRKKRGLIPRKQRDGSLKARPTDIGDGEDPFVRNIAEDCRVQGLPQMPASVTLRYFLEYSRVYYPAENYMIFLMGHGVIVGNDSFLPDADDGSGITLNALGKILRTFSEKVRKAGAEFHLVGFHSCSMNSIEVACELKGTARYMLGTQGFAFPGSWPYRQLLKKIFCAIRRDRGNQTNGSDYYPNELVQEILTGLQDLSFYNSEDFWNAGFSADLGMSCLDNAKLDNLTQPLRELSVALNKGVKNGAKQSILLAHWESQSYWGENYSDIYDLCDRLEKYCQGETAEQIAILAASGKVKAQLETHKRKSKDDVGPCFEKLVAFSDYYGPAYQFSHGLSIYFPWTSPANKVLDNYENYAFTTTNKPDSWLSFLLTYFEETRRPLRDEGGPVRPPLERVPSPPPNRISWDELTDQQLLWYGQPPPDKATGTLAGDPNKPIASLAGDPNKPIASLAGDPNRPTASLAGDPNKPIASLAGDPNKPTASLAGNPTKPTATVGIFGLTIIKNFSAPEDRFISSRRHSFKGQDDPDEPGSR